MNKLFQLSVLLFLSIWTLESFALEIDQKLTIRFLGISSTKKTVLLNRGLEDGLVVGDHAKFFLTSGVVARGMVVKASPSRSIWSLYRLVNPEKVAIDSVMNVKIASPVKVTEDPTKSLTEGPAKVAVEGLGEDDPELAELRGTSQTGKGPKLLLRSGRISSSKSLEVWGMASISGVSSTTIQGDISDEGQHVNMNLYAGGEKYFRSRNKFVRALSVSALVQRSSNSYESGPLQSSTSAWDLGGGVSWHFGASTFDKLEWIYYLNGTAGMSVVTRTSGEEELSGSGMFFSGGIGAKYYLSSLVGFRALFDYYYRNEEYLVEDEDPIKVSLGGFRILAGVSLRF